MANKYIIHGATYCGDGTASNEAASAGAAGAWNDINVFEGAAPAYGTLAAGDCTTIRSKTAAGADITRTLSADVNLGSAAATVTAPVTWVIDGGTEWPGVSGTVKYTTANTTYNPVLLSNNIIMAEVRGALVFESTATTTISDNSYVVDFQVNATLINAKIDYSTHATATPRFAAARLSNGNVLENLVIKAGMLTLSNSSPEAAMFSMALRRGEVTIINPDIELTNAGLGGTGLFFIDATYAGNIITVLGGRLYGVGTQTAGQPLLSHSGATANLASRIKTVGFDVPRTMTIVGRGGFYGGLSNSSSVELVGCDGGIGGHLDKAWGWATSRTDNNPPTLSAQLPDSNATPWAWRVYPAAASCANPMRLTTLGLYTDTAAAKTITQDILVADSLAPTKASVWLTVEYIDDTTGLPAHLSTRDVAGGALAASTANWTATTWGMITLIKKKLQITTPTAIRQNTPVLVTLWGILSSATVNDIFFVSPDFGVN